MVFSINNIKNQVRDTMRTYLNPSCTTSDTTYDLSDAIDVFKTGQAFKGYTKFYATVRPYKYTISADVKLKKTGTPDDDIILSLQSNSNDQPSGSVIGSSTIDVSNVATTFGVQSTNIVISSMLGSNTKYWLVLEPQCSASTVNFYSTQKTTVDTYQSGSLSVYEGSSWATETTDMYFDITVPKWIHNNHPRFDLSKYSFPRIAVDMTQRSVNQRWINSEIAEYTVDIKITGYSYYPTELDDILSYCDRALFKERIKFSNNVKRLDPGPMSPVIILRDDLASRYINYPIIFKMTKE